MPKPAKRRKYKRRVSKISNSGNPIVNESDWDRDVVVITDEGTKIAKGEEIEFVILRENGGHYQALLAHQAPVSKPKYYSPPNIPIHHDGKYGESVSETRPESHAFRPLKDRY